MNARTVPGLFRQRVQETPQSTAYYTLDKEGSWQPVTWDQAGRKVLALTRGLIELGLQPGDHVGIMASTSLSWELIQLAVLMSGAAVVGIDPRDLKENVQAIARRSKINALVVQTPETAMNLDSQILSSLRFVLVLQGSSNDLPGFYTWDSIQDFRKEDRLQDLDRSAPEDPATVIFTSGTTGVPKGIRYSHEQVVLACSSIVQAFPELESGSRMVCWLPLSNLFQRMINHCAILLNSSNYFVNDPRQIMELLPGIKPHVFIAVPRFFEKLYEGMMQDLRRKPWYIRRLVSLALKVGEERARAVRENRPEPVYCKALNALLDPLILKRFRAALGGEVRFMISGSAPMPLWLLQRFHALGLLVLEAYGISENIVPMAMNRPKAYKFGSVGLPLPANEMVLSPENEILVRGPGVCTSYYAHEEEKKLVDQDGFLHTGDLAEMDEQGFITLVGRNSEIIKTSTGRRIAPAGIESRLRSLDLVEQVMIIGDNRKYLTAIMSITRPGDQPDSAESGFKHGRQAGDLVQAIKKQVLEEIKDWPGYQRPAGLLVTEQPFTVQGGELTANLKLRRDRIQDKYQDSIEALYQALQEGEASAKSNKQEDIMVIQA